MTKERRRIQYQICEALKAADYDKARLYPSAGRVR